MQHRKLITIVLSILAAMILWAYTVVYVSPGSSMEYTSIPVVLRGEDVLRARGLILTSGQSQSVSIQVSGNRSDLRKLSSDNIRITADLSNITSPGTWNLSYSITYPDTVASGDLVAEEKSPATVKVEASLATVKTLKPTLHTTGTPREGFLLDAKNMKCDVESVTISGPSAEVDPITAVQVEVDVTDMDAAENRTYAYSLLDENGEEVTISDLTTVTMTRLEGSEGTGSDVIVTIPILPYKEMYLQANYVNVPDNLDVVACTFRPKKITVTGDGQALSQQNNLLTVDVDCSTVTAQKSTWELSAVISLERGLVAYDVLDEEFDGISVTATVTVKEKPQPTQPSSSSSSGTEPSEPEP